MYNAKLRRVRICLLDFSSWHTFCYSLNFICIIECYDCQEVEELFT